MGPTFQSRGTEENQANTRMNWWLWAKPYGENGDWGERR